MSISKLGYASWATALLFSAGFASAQKSPYENLVLADCGIGLGVSGGSTSREMIYYPGDVWKGDGPETYKPTMMVNVPWSGSYPWGQAGGVSATTPNGDVFTVHINPKIKDPNPAGDAWHKYELDRPLKCYSYHKDKVYQLADGKWCSSAYVCNHRGKPYIKPGGSDNGNNNNNNGQDKTEITFSTTSDWVELYEKTVENVLATANNAFNDGSTDCDTTPIPLGSGCSIRWSCHGSTRERTLRRLSIAFSDLAKVKDFSSKRETTTPVCRTPDTRPGHEGQCRQWVDKVDRYVKLPRAIKGNMNNVPPAGSGRFTSLQGSMEYEIQCSKSIFECVLCKAIGKALAVASPAAGAAVTLTCTAAGC